MDEMTVPTVRLAFALALLVFLLAVALLVTGSPVLVVPLSERFGVPLGNVITWCGMLALVMMIWFGSQGLRQPSGLRDRIYRRIWFVLLALAVLWPFVSFALAGNWSFSFRVQEGFRGSSRAADWFFRYSYAVVLLPFLFAAARGIHVVIARWRGRN